MFMRGCQVISACSKTREETGLYFSRRTFLSTAAMSGAFLLSRMQVWAIAPDSAAVQPPCFAHGGAPFAPFMDEFLARIEPGGDAFPNERYAAQLEAILETWARDLCLSTPDLRALHASISANITASFFDQPHIQKLRTGLPLETEQITFPAPQAMTSDAFVHALHEYLLPMRSAQLRIDSIVVTSTAPLLQVRTIVYYNLASRDIERAREPFREQRTGSWELHWQQLEDTRWEIVAWKALQESRSRLVGPGFVDVSAQCLGHIASYAEQLRHGTDYWRTALDGASGIDLYGNNGVTVGDFDGDGLDDLYICQAAGLPNRLYRNRGDGTFEDVTDHAGVGVLDATSSALFGDFTNNGRQDLIVVRANGPLFFRNRGDGTFEYKQDAFEFAKAPQGTFTAIAAADYNGDGLLDVYFCLYSYYQGLSAYKFPSPYCDSRNGPPNFLFKNRGDGTFEDVTASSGMNSHNNRYSFACAWNDYDNDGWPDLYVANDFGKKNLYRNNGDGTFTDVSAEVGVEDPGAGMSVCWFDYDNDGFDDLYVANMWSYAGRRVTTQDGFLPSAPENVRSIYRQHASGNSLFHNKGGRLAFDDATEPSGTAIGNWAWSSDAWDIDQDGYPDLYVTNGFISGTRQDNLSSFFWRQVVARSLPGGGDSSEYEEAWNAINELIRSDYSWSGYQRNNVYINDRNGHFTESAGVLGLDLIDDSRSFALADIDGDGRLEVIVKNRTAPQVRILHNELDSLGHSIHISLKGTKCNRDAIGAVVQIKTPRGTQRNTVRAGSGFLAQHSKTVAFGLGDYTGPVRAAVQWPGGTQQVFENLPVNHKIHIEEGNASVTAAAFRNSPYSRVPSIQRATAEVTEENLSGAFQTWLVEPLFLPTVLSTGHEGDTRPLIPAGDKSLLLLFTARDCADSSKQLRAVQALWPLLHSNLDVIALQVDVASTPADPQTSLAANASSREWPFPLLPLNARSTLIYSIFYRFLFDRRRDMPLPTSMLLNSERKVLKIYSGAVDPARVLQDMQMVPATDKERLRLAFPFNGHYFGDALHHNDFSFGVAFQRYGYPDQAIPLFQQAIARKPDFAGSYYNLGLIYIGRKMFAEARSNLETAVRLDPTNANAWNNIGVSYGQQKDYARAEENFRKALALQPSHLNALANLVTLCTFLGRLQDAGQLVEQAIAASPGAAKPHELMARLQMQQGNTSAAKQEFEHAIELQPGSAEARNGLGVVLMHMGDIDGAKQRFMECTQLAPMFSAPYLNLALLAAKAGDLQQARDILSGYLRKQPDNAEVRRALTQLEGRQ
jgi:tetratricopeptide (TPR) repeat protein